MNATLVAGDGRRSFEGAALDSRRALAGQLFFALAGERTDGHRFLPQAAAARVAAAVVEAPRLSRTRSGLHGQELLRFDQAIVGLPRLEVEDSYHALHALVRKVRDDVPQRLVGITGSAGKTTTKELLSSMLARSYRTAASPGNYNSLYGFPLALLGIADDTEWMVAEMAMSTPGELRQLSALARPDVAVITNVRLAHLEAFDEVGGRAGLREIAESKAGILEGLSPEGLVVGNAADSEVVRVIRRHLARSPDARAVWFALDRDRAEEAPLLEVADLRFRDRASGSTPEFTLSSSGEESGDSVAVQLPLHGAVNVENFLAAATCAASLGVPLAEIAAAAAGLSPLTGRGEVVRLASGARLVDDSYNSNPDALVKAAREAAGLGGRRRWAVVGSMLELGESSRSLHRQTGDAIAASGLSPLFVVGEEARPLIEAALASGVEGRFFATAAEAAEAAAAELRDGDVVLVKASRGVGLETVVAALVEAGGGRHRESAPVVGRSS